MPTKPPHLRREFAERFKDPGVVIAYGARPPYPSETFKVLGALAGGDKGRLLDVGCGTGAIARGVASLVGSVVAVDPSEPMLEAARALPGGDMSNILWKAGRIEEVGLNLPFSLIVGAQSLHWTDWDVVFPLFRGALGPGGLLAVVDLQTESEWDDELQRLIAKFSTNPDFQPYDMISAWQEAGWFEKDGEWKSHIKTVEQSVDTYLQFLHSMSSLTRASMGDAKAREFDEEVKTTLASQMRSTPVSYGVSSSIVWGRVLALGT